MTSRAATSLAAPAEVPGPLDWVHAVARTVLGRPDPTDAFVQTATGTAVATVHDADVPRRWLADAGPRGLLTPTHRWDALVRLAPLGEDVDERVRQELGRDRSSVARLAALEEVLHEPDLPPVLVRTWSNLLHDQRRAGPRRRGAA